MKNNVLTLLSIDKLSGQAVYEQGLSYVKAERVEWLIFDAENSHYEATIHSKRKEFVVIDIDSQDRIEASCFCTIHKDSYCEHIVAGLLSLRQMIFGDDADYSMSTVSLSTEVQKHTALSVNSQRTSASEASEQLLAIFHEQKLPPASNSYIQDARTELSVEYIIKLTSNESGRTIIMLELRIGTARLYVAQQLKLLLQRIARKASYVFTSQFTYLPKQHRFSATDFDIIEQLIQLAQQEQLYEEPLTRSRKSSERMLFIPPLAWEQLMPKLEAIEHVRVIDETRGSMQTVFNRLLHFQQPLPVHFHFQEHSNQKNGYELIADGLNDLTLMPDYRLAFTDGSLIDVGEQECSLLAQLQQVTKRTNSTAIFIPSHHMETYIDQVIPSLKKLGEVQLADSIADKVMQYPLKARIYLDRVKDRLLVGVEFQYGDIIINPLADRTSARGAERILIYDSEKEAHIMGLLEHDHIFRTEGGFIIEDEDVQFMMLYELVPELEHLADIYATTAIKEKLFAEQLHPIVHLSFNERTDWLEFKLQLDGISEQEIRELVKAIEVKRRYFKLSNGALIPMRGSGFERLIKLMNEIGLHHIAWDGAAGHAPAVRALSLLQFPDDIGSSFKLSRALRERLDNIKHPDQLNFPIPPLLEPILRGYQKFGYQWMRTLAYYGCGGILADDMGLGKTLQSIAFLLSILDEIRGKQPALIVAPASLTYNWLNELAKFAPEIKTAVVDGTYAKRKQMIANKQKMDVLITSYPMLRQDIEHYKKHHFHTLLLDEAQFFKNETTQTALAVKALAAKHKFALTGTPIENRIEDLRSIFHAIFPELFDDRDIFRYMPHELIAKRSAPFLLRRLKSDVARELPPKIESTQASELLPEQKKLYLAYLAKLRQDTLKHLDQDTFGKERIKILAGLTRLRQLCCHPALFVDGYAGGSSKLLQLFQIIEECRSSGKRMLIFSQFTEMLGILARELGYMGVPYFYLDGATPARDRLALCESFNQGEKDIFLISLKAGGTGLNLTGADTVVLYDLWWNPAVEDQAADRAHRIGQKKVVQVIRLIAQGTIEEKMLRLQQRKKNLIDAIIQPDQHTAATLTEQDIRELLAIE